jgi:large subunit ribosomal protein L29
MKLKEMRVLSAGELHNRLDDARDELMKLRFQMATGALTDFTRLRQTRRTIARLLTVLKEQESESHEEGEA